MAFEVMFPPGSLVSFPWRQVTSASKVAILLYAVVSRTEFWRKEIIRNHTLFQSNVRCRRGMYLAMIKRRLWRTVKDVGVENDLVNDLGFNLYIVPRSPVVRLVTYFGVKEVVKTEVLRSRVKEPEWTI